MSDVITNAYLNNDYSWTICGAAFYCHGEDNIDMKMLEEIWNQKPWWVWNRNQHWFKLNRNGCQKRIEIIKKAIYDVGKHDATFHDMER